jgi:hypothetical protein
MVTIAHIISILLEFYLSIPIIKCTINNKGKHVVNIKFELHHNPMSNPNSKESIIEPLTKKSNLQIILFFYVTFFCFPIILYLPLLINTRGFVSSSYSKFYFYLKNSCDFMYVGPIDNFSLRCEDKQKKLGRFEDST